MEDSLFAYSLCQTGDGWSWRLWDEVGEVVAAGAAPDQLSAEKGLKQAFERTQLEADRPPPGPAARRRDRSNRVSRAGRAQALAARLRSGLQAEG